MKPFLVSFRSGTVIYNTASFIYLNVPHSSVVTLNQTILLF